MRLIDADWLLEHRFKELSGYDTYDLKEILECAPTVEQKHGHWELINNDYIACSLCGEKLTKNRFTPYCDNCGASMTKGKSLIL